MFVPSTQACIFYFFKKIFKRSKLEQKTDFAYLKFNIAR